MIGLKRSHVFWRALACLPALCAASCVAPQPATAQKIVIPAEAGDSLKASAADAAQILQKMTGQEYSVGSEYSGKGIFLALAAAKDAPADAAKLLAGKSREGFLIRSNGDGVLRIASLSENGLSHGLYFYLEQLGARFYFPSDNWTIIPQRKDIALKIDRVVMPDFYSRDMGGTGGFGPKTPVDPKLEMKDRWNTWMRRNRFGEEYYIGGHAGQAFNMDRKDVLLAHPEYLAKVNGQYVPWSVGAKLNIGNPDAVKLFVDWAVEEFRKARAKDPHYFAVSVETADGGGQCNSEECRAIGNGSSSDMLFYVANEAAKAIRKEFPDGWVSMLAYSDHAAVPSFDLEPNIYVKVIPYAFQTTGLSPEELIKAWGKKVKRMSIYDYWSITDWANNQPSFDYLSTPADKLRLWKANNMEGFRGESTYSAGAMGLGWYVASHLMWDVNADDKALIEEFYDKAFGPAKAPMKRMLERWATGYRLEANQLGFAYRDLAEARRLAAGNAAVMARLDDYAKYLHYLRLWYEFQESAVQAPEQRKAATARLLEYLWDIYDSGMVHTVRTAQLILNRYAPDPQLKAEFDYKNKNAPFWKDVKPPSHDEVEALVADGLKNYPVLFQPAYYALDDLKPFSGAQANDEWVTAPTRLGTSEFAVLRGPDTGPVQFMGGKDNFKVRLTIFRQGDKQHKTQVELGAGDWQDVPLPAAPGIYHIIAQPSRAVGYQLRARPQAFLTAVNSVEIRQPRDVTYFYVAPGQKVVALQTPGLSAKYPIEVMDGDGNKLTVNEGMLKIIPVPAGQDGRLWSIRGHSGNRSRPLTFLNGPRVYGFSPAGLLVPSNPVPQESLRAEDDEEDAPAPDAD